MKEIRGFVCIADVVEGKKVEIRFLFGKNMGRGTGAYESLETNGLTPFANLAEARIAKEQLQHRKNPQFKMVSIAKIEMELAENEKDLFLLRKRKRLVVIMRIPDSKETIPIGRFVEGRPSCYPVPGAYLSDNGLKPFPSFERAEYVGQEVMRQAQCGAQIATFKLTPCD